MDLPRSFTIRESSHRIHNPFTGEKLAALGQALHLAPGTRALDLASGSGEMLCTWARAHGIVGTGVDISTEFTAKAQARAAELGVSDQVRFVHGDASGHVADEPVDLAACVGATWIGDGVPGTAELLRRSLRPGGMLLIGEPYWRRAPDQRTAEACSAAGKDDFRLLPELIEQFGELGYDVVEMMLADQDSWDRYRAPQWLNIRRWLDSGPDDDELAAELREELSRGPARYARYEREYLGWGVFALMAR
jgi:SAM-dependent methyltransferase